MKIFSASNLLKVFAVFTVAVIGLPFIGSAQQVITLQQAVDSTLKNNLQIRQAQFSAALTKEDLDASKYSRLPDLSGSLSSGLNFGTGSSINYLAYNGTNLRVSGDLSTSVNLFSGLTTVNQIRQNKLLLEADKTNVDKVRNDLVLQVVTSYLQVLYNTDLLKASQEQLAIANQTLKREQELINVGNKTLADLSQAKSQVATAELNATNALNALEVSYLTLGQLMELPPTQKFVVQAPLYDDSGNVKSSVDPNTVFEKALSTFPDIKMYDLRTQAARKAIDIAKGSYYPSLSLSAGLSTGYLYRFNYFEVDPVSHAVIYPTQTDFFSQFQDGLQPGINLSLRIPIFNRFSARTSVRKARINYENAKVSEQLTKNNLNKTIFQATVDLRAAESNYQSTTNTFLAQKDAFNVIEQRYNVGLVNSLDYSTARTNMNKAETDMIQAKYNLLFRAKVIDYYLGKQITF